MSAYVEGELDVPNIASQSIGTSNAYRSSRQNSKRAPEILNVQDLDTPRRQSEEAFSKNLNIKGAEFRTHTSIFDTHNVSEQVSEAASNFNKVHQLKLALNDKKYEARKHGESRLGVLMQEKQEDF